MGYKILGYLVWNGGKAYVKLRYGGAKRYAAVGIVGMAVAALVAMGAASRRGSSS